MFAPNQTEKRNPISWPSPSPAIYAGLLIWYRGLEVGKKPDHNTAPTMWRFVF